MPRYVPHCRRGISLIEILMVLLLVGLLAAFAWPPFQQMRVQASLSNAKHALTSTISLARSTAMRYGRSTTLRILPDSGVLWVEVDTTQIRSGANPLSLGRVNLSAEFGVRLISNRGNVCFDGRGLGIRTAECSATGGLFRIIRGEAEDSVVLSLTGRVTR